MWASSTHPPSSCASRPLPPYATTCSVALRAPSLLLASPSSSPTAFSSLLKWTQSQARFGGSMPSECAVIIGRQIRAIIFPLLLTSLLYLGPLTMAALEFYDDWHEGYLERFNGTGGYCSRHSVWDFLYSLKLLAFDVLAWRNFVLAPLTEEIVFRACMIPVLLCSGFQPITIIFVCPMFFGLAHVNHFWELVHHQNCDKKRALLIVGAQLGYTTVFGWYTSFLYLRTGNILAPLAAHIFCNIMGFPDLHGVFQRKGVFLIFFAGVFGFFFMLAPASRPFLYNDASESCYCWLGYCKWK